MRILLLHHTYYHFETVLSFAHILRSWHEVRVWSNFLAPENRGPLLAGLGLKVHALGDEYDLILVITGDERRTLKELGQEIDQLLANTRILYVQHRFRNVDVRDEVYLFPLALRPVIKSSTGLQFPKADAGDSSEEVRLLIQGNFQKSRRNYHLAGVLAAASENVIVDMVGRWTEGERPMDPRIRVHTDLDELRFHKTCANAHFIVPLIDPEQHPQYFSTTFTSSMLVSLSYSLPVIAHERLFELYPIHGFKYSSTEGLQEAVRDATRLSPSAYGAMVGQMIQTRDQLIQRNYDNIMSYLN